MKIFASDVTYGAITQLFAGTASEALEMNGGVSSLPPTHRFASLDLDPGRFLLEMEVEHES